MPGSAGPLPARSGPASALILVAVAMLAFTPLRAVPSDLLERVKQNPQQARSLCNELRALNGQGISALSPQGISSVARSQGLAPMDAEVLITYVVGLHCSDVR